MSRSIAIVQIVLSVEKICLSLSNSNACTRSAILNYCVGNISHLADLADPSPIQYWSKKFSKHTLLYYTAWLELYVDSLQNKPHCITSK